MADKLYKEPIDIKYNVTSPDGRGGKSVSSVAVLYSPVARISEGGVNPNYDYADQYRNAQSMEFFSDPNKPITLDHWVEWRGKKLTIQMIKFNSNWTRVTLKTISQ